MHRLARRAGYPSDSSRAERSQLRAWPGAAIRRPRPGKAEHPRRRHPRHRTRPPERPGGAVLPRRAARGGRGATAAAPGNGSGAPPSPHLGGIAAQAVPRPRLRNAGRGNQPPPTCPAASRSGPGAHGLRPVGSPVDSLTLARMLRMTTVLLGPPGGRTAGL